MFSAAAVDRVRLNLIRSVVELEVVISHAKETEVIIPEKNKGENIYQVDLVVEVVVVSYPYQSEVMSASACVSGMLTRLSVVPVWIKRRSPVPWLSKSLELLQ